MKQNIKYLPSACFVLSLSAFVGLTFLVNPLTSGTTGIILWFASLGLSVFWGAYVLLKKYSQVKRRVLVSLLLSVTAVVAAALSSVQQLSISDLVLITVIDLIVYYAAARL